MKKILESAEECVGKIVVYGADLGLHRPIGSIRIRRYIVERELMEAEFIALPYPSWAGYPPGRIFYIAFFPGEFYTETPDYVDRWKDRIG